MRLMRIMSAQIRSYSRWYFDMHDSCSWILLLIEAHSTAATMALRVAIASFQCVFSSRHDLGSFGRAGAAGIPAYGRGVQIDGSFAGGVGDDVGGEYMADLSSCDVSLAHANHRFRAFDSIRSHIGIIRNTGAYRYSGAYLRLH